MASDQAATKFQAGDAVRWRGKPYRFRVVRPSSKTVAGEQTYLVDLEDEDGVSSGADYLVWERDLTKVPPSPDMAESRGRRSPG